MKVAVINFSGNVGKSTVAAHLLLPRIRDASIISVESLNLDAREDGVDVEQQRGKEFVGLVEDLLVREAAIVDVGASNAEDFMRGMRALDGSHAEFDYFVVPTVRTKKQIGDTISTITALASIGVPREKIRVVFNKIEEGEDVRHGFRALFETIREDDCCVVSPDAVVYANEVFERLKEVGTSLAEIRSDATPWRERVRAAKDGDERDRAIARLTLKRLSVSAGSNLDAAFKALFA
ncbi:MAG: plasmid stabilization protein [Rhodocyclales bacterium]|nr:plasmid stabilization protein [Rhodocyclales bacterium]